MKGYSKIKGKTSFIPRSNSNKEFLFLDKDFDNLSSKSNNKRTNLYEQEPSIIIDDEHHDNNKKKNDFFLGKSEDHDNDDDGGHHDHHSLKSEGGERVKGVLWRNLSVSSATPSYQKNNIKGDNHNNNNNNNNNNNMDCRLERQSSTRAIQDAVKRAFSKKRSSSVNSDRYCRIYDQPMNGDDCDYVYDDHSQHDNDDDFGKNGSFETRSGSMMNKNHHHYHNHHHNGKRNVGSKVVRACKRLFSR